MQGECGLFVGVSVGGLQRWLKWDRRCKHGPSKGPFVAQYVGNVKPVSTVPRHTVCWFGLNNYNRPDRVEPVMVNSMNRTLLCRWSSVLREKKRSTVRNWEIQIEIEMCLDCGIIGEIQNRVEWDIIEFGLEMNKDENDRNEKKAQEIKLWGVFLFGVICAGVTAFSVSSPNSFFFFFQIVVRIICNYFCS